jgi:hypothetical protein
MIGLGLAITSTRSAAEEEPASPPSALGDGDWTVVNALTTGDATITIVTPPADGGAAITDYDVRIAGGSWTSLGGATGPFTASGFTDWLSTNVEVRAVNAAGDGAGSSVKTVTTTPPSYVPTFVTNGGTSHLAREGALTGALDGVNFEMCFIVRNLENLDASAQRIWTSTGRHDVSFNASKKLTVLLDDTSGNALVDWAATPVIGAGAWVVHIRAILTGTPLFEVYALNLLDGTPSWAAVAGSFNVGPTNGTIDLARISTGTDTSILASASATGIMGAPPQWGAIAVNLDGGDTPLGRDQFYASGALRDPTTLSAIFTCIFAGSHTDWDAGTNFGTGEDFVKTGDFADT